MILIVDSEKLQLVAVKQVFENFGIKSVEWVKSIEESNAFIESFNVQYPEDIISLVIIDSELSDGEGVKYCEVLKKHELTRQSYIMLVISSAENKSAIEQVDRSSANSYTVKPYGSKAFIRQFLHFVVKHTVLVVDDDPVIRKILRKVLINHNIEVIEVDNGQDANNILNTMFPPKLIFMDIALPHMNGIQLVTKIKTKKAWLNIPIIMITASTDIEDVKKSLKAGATDYIAKPFDIESLTKRIAGYLSSDG